MSREEHTEEIVDFALIPVCAVEEGCYRGDGRGFVGVCFDADARVVPDREQVVDDFEAVGLRGVVDGGYVADLRVFGGGVEFEEGEDGEDAGGSAGGCVSGLGKSRGARG